MSENGQLQTIVQLPNGRYRWRCATDPAWLRAQLLTAFKVCAVISLAILAAGGVCYLLSRSWEPLLIFAVIAVSFLALSGLIFGLTLLITRHPAERYELCEQYIQTGAGRYASFFDFKRTRTLTIHRDYLELRGRIAAMRVYAPEADFPFVRDYIRRRMPDEAEIHFE